MFRRPLLCSAILIALTAPVHLAAKPPALKRPALIALKSSSFGFSAEEKKASKAILSALTPVKDVSSLYALLHPLVLMSLDTPVPAGWPAALRDDWERGFAACRAQAIKKPYHTVKNVGAFTCSRSLSPYLWQRFIVHERAAQVLELTLEIDAGKTEISIASYGSSSPLTRTLSSTGNNAVALTLGLLERLDAGQGTTSPRHIQEALPEHPTATSPHLFAGVVQSLPPVPQPHDCANGVPAAISIVPETSPFGKTLSAAWRATIAGRNATRPAVACNLRMFRVPTQFGSSLAAGLDCPDMRALHTMSPHSTTAAAHAQLATNLIGRLHKAYCAQLPKCTFQRRTNCRRN